MKVTFQPINVEVEIGPDETVLEVAQKNKVYIKSICNGVPSCAECRIRVVEGDHNVLPPGAKEKTLIGTAHYLDQRRLSCQLRCFGDVTIDLTEQVAKEQGEGLKKRQKAGVKADVSESRAQLGNLIDQDEALQDEATRDMGDDSIFEADESGSASAKSSGGGDASDKKEGSGKRRSRNRNRNRSKGGGGGAAQQAQGGNKKKASGGSQKSSDKGPEGNKDGGGTKKRRRRRPRRGPKKPSE